MKLTPTSLDVRFERMLRHAHVITMLRLHILNDNNNHNNKKPEKLVDDFFNAVLFLLFCAHE
jgi:hypothetical protein